MIRTNLSTRPFYDTRAVALWLAVAALLVAGATLFNVGRVLQYRAATRSSGDKRPRTPSKRRVSGPKRRGCAGASTAARWHGCPPRRDWRTT